MKENDQYNNISGRESDPAEKKSGEDSLLFRLLKLRPNAAKPSISESQHLDEQQEKETPEELQSQGEEEDYGPELEDKLEQELESEPAEEEAEEAEPPEPVDAVVDVVIDPGKMSAGVTVYPPEHGGAHVTRALLDEALAKKQVVFGIDTEMLDKIAQQRLYHTFVTVAKGQPPIDGENGQVFDEFPREREFKLTTKEDGSIDFKNLNLILDVKAGTLLCTITKPTQPVDGTNVFGNPVGARPGKEAFMPAGKNTRVSEDGLQLFAAVDGNLVFSDNRFNVEQVFVVQENVDNSVGNIDFSGDVVVKGDVLEGYVIRAKGDVTIKGMVEGASIFAGGNITIMNGMNGMKKGILESKKEIRSKYLENCTIKAEGAIYADSIINSTVFCNDKLVVTGKRGAIIGGSCTVLRSIEAKVVGTPSYTATAITIGATPEILLRRNDTLRQIEELKTEMSNNANNIVYLERFEAAGTLSAERSKLLAQLRRQKPISMLKLSQLNKTLEDTNEIIQNVTACKLTCNQIHPPTRITIGHATTIVQDTMNKCYFFYADGEIKVGYQ